MSLIDDIKRDREAGTPGRWTRQSPGDAIFHKTDLPFDHKIPVAVAVGANSTWFYDAGRIARVPDMEAALLAAEELAGALTTYNQNGAGPLDGWMDVMDALAAYRKATGAK